MKSNIEISQEAKVLPIDQIAARLGIAEEELIPFGRHMAKVP
ncbi:MAG: formate--tetrahydrofolate ligase, partial [Methanomassiliicoccales archaeon]|nr:formate--tetrahydrofolate ligase [Methanomassiliicoccales archaeon]